MEIDLTTEPDGRSLRIEVKDNGPGVADEKKERIFEHFFTSRPGRDPGLGLGLGFVREVIASHGGTIVEKGLPGQGAHFEIRLPILSQSHENGT